MSKPASRAQIVALQTLFTAWHSRTLTDESDLRSARLAWASDQLSRPVSSFGELSADGARQLIDTLKSSLGQKPQQQARPWHHIESRDRAYAAGTAGRRSRYDEDDVIRLVGPDDLARIDEALVRLGWTQERFDGWLKSGTSPLGKREDPAIRTVAEANRIWWALKAMMVRAGIWKTNRQAV